MRYEVDSKGRSRVSRRARTNLLTAIYPGIYCPRCGSREIGPRRLVGDEVIWKCVDCDVDFKLIFPANSRF